MKKPGRPRKLLPEDEAKRVRVRCLGPGGEHTFRSPDPKRVRVCWACRVRLARMGGTSGGTQNDRRRKGFADGKLS